ncbi:hypothetical protein CJJ23_03380 [Mycoplasmopsis agassizii]|uniref:Uncharacterized protein n=1 Tax=Mycoplasmopsis agassizii TaxID=33922 RepID=A0A269TK65_9BACT|nr:hypothetical protein [Mycoplasmopsis agassizii]PAK21155.1 hypothetical protein CJJ23_03380 [Mycoplasmopsis agassizii]
MSNKDSKIVVNRPCAEVKKLTKTHDMKETVNSVEIHPFTNKARYKYEAEGDPLPPILPPPLGPTDDEDFNKEWVLKQIRLAASELRSEMKDGNEQIRSEMNQKFDEAKSENLQIEKRIEKKFDAKLKKATNEIRSEMKEGFSRAEKQNKETNEKLEEILDFLKKKDK